MMTFENTLQIGQGIYTIQEMARILRQPYHIVRHWVNTYWDGKLGEAYGAAYSWRTDGSQAVSFHTLVEFYLLMLLGEAGVPPRKVIQAHQALRRLNSIPFPFCGAQRIRKPTHRRQSYLF